MSYCFTHRIPYAGSEASNSPSRKLRGSTPHYTKHGPSDSRQYGKPQRFVQSQRLHLHLSTLSDSGGVHFSAQHGQPPVPIRQGGKRGGEDLQSKCDDSHNETCDSIVGSGEEVSQEHTSIKRLG
ncbi:hypothetical protein CONLIGDRAFT_184481 [Coniochaeta ligniaria NRRL 30616]|uniref:Uncharacterized protein n=1 Tax=Coniochaeta ligniaria NRRL 30616 TaxID=1408157 RepID=A0A1J7J289_9PEZI|nr:hypothetical protein CONLIGDRAFT_184481 [Coniochaeta ligniaria NRRL 30616]